MFMEKVAVSVTCPVVITLSESLEVMARVAGEFEPEGGAAVFGLRQAGLLPLNLGLNEELFLIGLLFPQIFCLLLYIFWLFGKHQ